ncbi:MAG TPA: hypothetical protein VEC37_03530 [Bacillota bacterium]|nr:hypothetical protein [Bacillota bacterium]
MHQGYTGGNYGFSIGNFIGGLLIFFFKLLVLALIVALIAGVFVWIKNSFFKDGAPQFKNQTIQTLTNDPILKAVSLTLLAIVGLVLVFALFDGFNGYGGNMMQNGVYGGFTFNLAPGASLSIISLLLFLTKLLMWILVIALVMAAIVFVKNQYESGNLNFLKPKNQSPLEPTGPTIDIEPNDTSK